MEAQAPVGWQEGAADKLGELLQHVSRWRTQEHEEVQDTTDSAVRDAWQRL